MAAVMALELAGKELTDRHETILDSKPSSSVSNSGLAFSQQAIASSCGSRKRRLVFLVLAPLSFFAVLGAIVPQFGLRHELGGADEGLASLKGRKGKRKGAREGEWEREREGERAAEEAEVAPALERIWKNWESLFSLNETEDVGVPKFLSKFWTPKLGTAPVSWEDHCFDRTRYEVMSTQDLRALPEHVGLATGPVGPVVKLFYCSQRRVIKVEEMLVKDSGHGLAEMYRQFLLGRVINPIGENVLGYLNIDFPLRTATSVYRTQVMENGGYCAHCLVKSRLVQRSKCPDTTSPWGVKGAFSLKHKVAIVLGALRAVQSMRRVGFLKHGDVKPENLMLPENARDMTPVELAGATKLIDHECAAIRFESIKPVMACGTQGYVPEEVISWDLSGNSDQDTRRKLHSRMDVFACGMTLFQLVVGKHFDLLFSQRNEWGNLRGFLGTLAADYLDEKAKHQSVYEAGGREVIPLLRGMLEQNGELRWDVEHAVGQVENFLL